MFRLFIVGVLLLLSVNLILATEHDFEVKYFLLNPLTDENEEVSRAQALNHGTFQVRYYDADGRERKRIEYLEGLTGQITYYTPQGRVRRWERYDGGALSCYDVLSYDENGTLVNRQSFNHFDEREAVAQFDSQEQVRVQYYYSPGEIRDLAIVYREDGKVNYWENYDQRGRLTDRTRHQYYPDGTKQKTFHYNDSNQRIAADYHSINGNIVRRDVYNNHNQIQTIFLFFYDNQNRQTRTEEYNNSMQLVRTHYFTSSGELATVVDARSGEVTTLDQPPSEQSDNQQPRVENYLH